MIELHKPLCLPKYSIFSLLIISALLFSGCGGEVVEIKNVQQLKEQAQELDGKLVQVSGEVRFVGESKKA